MEKLSEMYGIDGYMKENVRKMKNKRTQRKTEREKQQENKRETNRKKTKERERVVVTHTYI